MAADHELFRGPLPVTPTIVDSATPEQYRTCFDGKELGPRIPVWRVHGELAQPNFGLVCDPYGFTDSPDCEVIARGFDAKGPRSLAIARQGNWLLWGFCASPSEMTEEARRVFLNAVVYMRQFDGQSPLVRKKASAREWALVHASRVGQAGDRYARSRFVEELLSAAGNDSGRLSAILAEDLEYVRADGEGPFSIDAEAKAIGVSNRDLRLLDGCIGRLEGQADDDVARRLLERYTGERHADAAAWRAWLDERRDRLFFTDCGGYRWMASPR